MKNNVFRNRVIIIGGSVIFILLVIVLTIISLNGAKLDLSKVPSTATVENIDSCYNNLDNNMLKAIQTQLYSFIKIANNFNNSPTQVRYSDAVLRKNSCSTDKNGQTNAIIDVPSAKQSWNISYFNKSSSSLGQGVVPQISCPSDSELIYGDFHCKAALLTSYYNCYPNGNIPGYANFGGVASLNSGVDVPNIENVLNKYIVNQNNSSNLNNNVICVAAISNNTAPVVLNGTVSDTFQVYFISRNGAIQIHSIIYLVDNNFNITVTVDGNNISQ